MSYSFLILSGNGFTLLSSNSASILGGRSALDISEEVSLLVQSLIWNYFFISRTAVTTSFLGVDCLI